MQNAANEGRRALFHWTTPDGNSIEFGHPQPVVVTVWNTKLEEIAGILPCFHFLIAICLGLLLRPWSNGTLNWRTRTLSTDSNLPEDENGDGGHGDNGEQMQEMPIEDELKSSYLTLNETFFYE